jgi:hypothetical protein
MLDSITADAIRLTQSLSRVAPLGARFWDDLSQSFVCGGLSVTAYPAESPDRRLPGFPNRVGVYVFRNLPGIRDQEFGTGDDEYWLDVTQRPFVVEVVDREGRFQPFSIDVALPLRDILAWTSPFAGSPPETPDALPLYSAPTRNVAGPFAVLRAELWDPIAKLPAAWAAIEAEVARLPIVRGFADAKGRIALVFAYPEPRTDLGARRSLHKQTWPIRLQARYGPAQPVPKIPDLLRTMTQSSATLWADSARTQVLTEATLAYGRELTLKTRDSVNGVMLPVLLITPAGSPP